MSTLDTAEQATVRVGAASSPERVLLAELYAGALKRVGVEEQVRTDLGDDARVAAALGDGEIDVVVLPVEVAYRVWIGAEDVPADPAVVVNKLAAVLDPLGVAVLTPSPFGGTGGRAVVPIVRKDRIGYSLKTVFERVSRQVQAADLDALADRADRLGADPERLADEWLEAHGFGPETAEDAAG